MKILFICTGNTCRSCMAEVMFNEACNIDGITSLSAGVNAISGTVTSKNSSELVKEKLNSDISERMAVQLDDKLVNEADLVLAMSKSAKYAAIKYFQVPRDIIFTLNEYVGVEGEVSDPYGGDSFVYEKTYEQICDLIFLLINKLKEDKGIA